MAEAFEHFADAEFHGNFSCDDDFVPSAVETIERLGVFGVGALSCGTILSTLTLYFAVDACYNVICQKETLSYKTNCIVILAVYPIASLCSLSAMAVPRAQLLSDAVTTIYLTIALYRLYLLMLEFGSRKITKPPTLMLKVGPCCCWPCLPFPTLQMTEDHMAWVGIFVLQFPIVQILVYSIFLFMEVEEPILTVQYGVFLQPFAVISILTGLYGLAITMRSLDPLIPEAKLRQRTAISQMVLLFTKLQAAIVRALAATSLFPCNPPLTPRIYANVTSNSLVLLEMLALCYAAKRLYQVDLEKDAETTTDRPKDKADPTDLTNNNENCQSNNNEGRRCVVQVTAVTVP